MKTHTYFLRLCAGLILPLFFILSAAAFNTAQAQTSKPNAMTQRLQQLADIAAQALPSPVTAPTLAPQTVPVNAPQIAPVIAPLFAPQTNPSLVQALNAEPAAAHAAISSALAPALSSEGSPMLIPAFVPAPAPAAAAIVSATAPKPVPSPTTVANMAATEPEPVLTQDPEKIKAYKKLVAQHLYKTHAQQVLKGKLPPNLPAVAVVDLTINAEGRLETLNWRRRPANVEFAPITEKYVRAGDPFPLPTGLGRVHFLEIWLWTKEQRFQLDSLTEGQN